MDYTWVSDQPLELRRVGVDPNVLVVIFGWGGLFGALISILAYPGLEQGGGEGGALGFVGALVFGSVALVGAFLAGSRDASRGLVIGQPSRLQVLVEHGAGDNLIIDRRRFPANQVRRVEVQRVPVYEGDPRYMLALVFDFGLVELSFRDGDLAARSAAALAARLQLPAPRHRARPMLRAYAWGPVAVMIVAILAEVAVMIWMLMSEPSDALAAAPMAAAMALCNALVYLSARVTGRATTRAFLQVEYELRLPS